MEFELKDIVAIVTPVVALIIGYFTAVMRTRKHINEKVEAIHSEISALKVEVTELKGKDQLQQQILESLNDHVYGLLENAVNKKKKR